MEVSNLEITQFTAFLLKKGLKRGTVYRHLNTLKTHVSRLPDLQSSSVESYLADLKLADKRHSYINGILFSIRTWCEFKGLPKPAVTQYKTQDFQKATMSDEEIEQFLNIPAKRHGEKEIRNHAVWTLFFSIMAYTGMRPGEVAHLTIDAVDFGRGVFVLNDTKTNDSRVVPIPPNIEVQVRSYIDGLPGKFLFASTRGGKSLRGSDGTVFDSVDWFYNFHTRIKRLGIRRVNLTVYSLRHSLITRLLEEDVNLFKVQKIVGHKRVETTALYTHLTTKDIKLALNKHPIIRAHLDPKSKLHALVEVFHHMFDQDRGFEKTVEEKDDEVVIRIKIKSPS